MLEFSDKYSTKEITTIYIKECWNINDEILSDSQIITISIVCELITIDS